MRACSGWTAVLLGRAASGRRSPRDLAAWPERLRGAAGRAAGARDRRPAAVVGRRWSSSVGARARARHPHAHGRRTAVGSARSATRRARMRTSARSSTRSTSRSTRASARWQAPCSLGRRAVRGAGARRGASGMGGTLVQLHPFVASAAMRFDAQLAPACLRCATRARTLARGADAASPARASCPIRRRSTCSTCIYAAAADALIARARSTRRRRDGVWLAERFAPRRHAVRSSCDASRSTCGENLRRSQTPAGSCASASSRRRAAYRDERPATKRAPRPAALAFGAVREQCTPTCPRARRCAAGCRPRSMSMPPSRCASSMPSKAAPSTPSSAARTTRPTCSPSCTMTTHPRAGDIVLCAPVVRTRSGRRRANRLAAHYAHLVVHGMLHLQGYDHERRRAKRAAHGSDGETAIPRARLGRSADPYAAWTMTDDETRKAATSPRCSSASRRCSCASPRTASS